MASGLISYLPPAEGLLPKWLLLVSVVALGNTVQTYTSLKYTREVYAGSEAIKAPAGIPARTVPQESASPVTPLSARTFGTWSAINALVRLYAAYHINEPAMYEICLWTFGIAWLHFMSEWWVYGSARWNRGLAGPIFVATGSTLWMLLQWGWYVR